MRGPAAVYRSLFLLLFVTTAACTRNDPPLVAPTQLSPAPGAVFDSGPRATELVWTRVPGAATYSVEVEPYCVDRAMWCTEAGNAALLYTANEIADTTHTFNHVGAQPGRWRVWAVDRAGTPGPKTDWSRFEYRR